MNTLEGYEAWLLESVKFYSVTEFLGRGKYSKEYFGSRNDAVARYNEVKGSGRFLIYAICHPKCRSIPVSILIKA